jgi:hypothetical protein
MTVYEFPDGTVVRYKPLGDSERPMATFSIEVKKNPALPDMGPDDVAFKVSADGQAVAKGPNDIANPYSKATEKAQFVLYEKSMMDAGHQSLEK